MSSWKSDDGNTFYGQESEEDESGWVYDGISKRKVPKLSGRSTAVSGISGDGSIVVGNTDRRKAFLWEVCSRSVKQLSSIRSGRLISREDAANAISDDGEVIVGYSEQYRRSNSQGLRAAIWTKGGSSVKSLGSLGGVSSATGVSGDGSLVVGYSDSNKGREAFIWSNNTKMQSIGDLEGGEYHSEATDISSDGVLVVGLGTGSDGSIGFIWDESRGMRDIASVLGRYGWQFEGGVADISANGKYLCGNAFNPRGESQGWVAHDPLWVVGYKIRRNVSLPLQGKQLDLRGVQGLGLSSHLCHTNRS